jgi:hypothetical protein
MNKKFFFPSALERIAFSIGCFVGFGFLLNGSLIYLLLFAVALIIGAAAGSRHLSLPARTFITTQIFCWNFMLCLLGRTVEPGITRGNTSMVLLYFGIYGFVPGLCLLRLWRWKFGTILLGALLPVGFALALLVAGIEERVFVIKYRGTGIGPTPRWTVGTHWLAYDRDTGRLTATLPKRTERALVSDV